MIGGRKGSNNTNKLSPQERYAKTRQEAIQFK